MNFIMEKVEKKYLMTPCNLYTLLWCLYNLQGVLYPEGGLISRTILMVLILVSIKHMFFCIKMKDQPIFFKGLNAMMIFFAIYGAYRLFFDNRTFPVDSFLFVKDVLISTLPIYSYYYYTIRGQLNERVLIWYFFLLFIVTEIAAAYSYQQKLSRSSVDVIANNGAYKVLGLLPLVCFFWKKPIVKYFLIVSLIIVLLTMVKRGAIICGGLGLLWIVFQDIRNRSSKKNNVITLFVIAVSTIVIYYYIGHIFVTNEFFAERFYQTMDGKMSAREDMYPMMYRYFFNQDSVFHLLFGNGLDGTLFIFDVQAHNDWLEIAIDMGLLGVLLYIYYWFCSYKMIKEIGRIDRIVYIAFSVCILLDFVKTFFSFSFYDRPLAVSCTMGFCLAFNKLSKTYITTK